MCVCLFVFSPILQKQLNRLSLNFERRDPLVRAKRFCIRPVVLLKTEKNRLYANKAWVWIRKIEEAGKKEGLELGRDRGRWAEKGFRGCQKCVRLRYQTTIISERSHLYTNLSQKMVKIMDIKVPFKIECTIF